MTKSNDGDSRLNRNSRDRRDSLTKDDNSSIKDKQGNQGNGLFGDGLDGNNNSNGEGGSGNGNKNNIEDIIKVGDDSD